MPLRTWTLPTLPKATIEDPNDVSLGWTAQHTLGPTETAAFAPYKNAVTKNGNNSNKYPTAGTNSTY